MNIRLNISGEVTTFIDADRSINVPNDVTDKEIESILSDLVDEGEWEDADQCPVRFDYKPSDHVRLTGEFDWEEDYPDCDDEACITFVRDESGKLVRK